MARQTLTVRVLDDTGTPVEGARVSLRTIAPDAPFTERLDYTPAGTLAAPAMRTTPASGVVTFPCWPTNDLRQRSWYRCDITAGGATRRVRFAMPGQDTTLVDAVTHSPGPPVPPPQGLELAVETDGVQVGNRNVSTIDFRGDVTASVVVDPNDATKRIITFDAGGGSRNRWRGAWTSVQTFEGGDFSLNGGKVWLALRDVAASSTVPKEGADWTEASAQDIPEQVQSDWNAASGAAAILHKPAAGVAGGLMPAGGTKGQVPVKGDGTAVAWGDAAAGGEDNVQSDWAVTDTGSDAFIKNKPTIPDAQVQADWTETDSGDASYIENKPSLATVATSGAYADLTGKPTIPTDTTLFRGAWVANASPQYEPGQIVTRSNTVQLCITANSDAVFTQSKWEQLDVGAPSDLVSVAQSGRTITFTKRDGTTQDVVIPADAFTAAYKTKVDGIEAGAQKNPKHVIRFSAQNSDADTLESGEIGFYNGATDVQGAGDGPIDTIHVAARNAAFGQDPTQPGTDLTAVASGPLLEDAVDNGGAVLLIAQRPGSSVSHYAQARTIAKRTGGYTLTSLDWHNEPVITGTGVAWNIAIGRTEGVLVDDIVDFASVIAAYVKKTDLEGHDSDLYASYNNGLIGAGYRSGDWSFFTGTTAPTNDRSIVASRTSRAGRAWWRSGGCVPTATRTSWRGRRYRRLLSTRTAGSSMRRSRGRATRGTCVSP